MTRRIRTDDRLAELYDLICAHPGNSSYWYAKRIGVPKTNMGRVLASAELLGYLLAEDDRGRLYPSPWNTRRFYDPDTDPLF